MWPRVPRGIRAGREEGTITAGVAPFRSRRLGELGACRARVRGRERAGDIVQKYFCEGSILDPAP